MPVLPALLAWLCALELAAQVALHRLAHRAVGSGYTLDAVLLKEHDGPAPHATGEHHVCPQAADKARYLARLVLPKEGVIHLTDLR